MKKEKAVNVMLIFSCTFYGVFIVWNILFKYVSPLSLFSDGRYFSRSLNLIPFNDLLRGHYNRLDLWGNILLFVPLGIYLNLLKQSKWHEQILTGAGISLLFEALQYAFAIGASDITDVIYNTIGCALGVGAYNLLKLIFKTRSRVKALVAVLSCAAAIGVGIIVLLLFAYN